MKEVLTRRMEKLNSDDISFSSMPDLIIIDGGKGQLSSAVEIMEKYHFTNDLISLAKREEEVFKPNQSNPYILAKGSYSLRLIQLARDEAHRFAIGTHRKKRSKSMMYSKLDDVEGIGPKKKRDLLNYFGSVEAIKNASIKDITKVDGINKKTAENIYKYFHK
jgi:excinuclease ABC subunit C